PWRYRSSRRALCRSGSAWRKASRPASSTADQIPDGYKPKDRQGARPYHSAEPARPRRRGDRMRRREFIAGLGGAAAWPLAARAQQPGKVPTVGLLGGVSSNRSVTADVFLRRLRELGWVEGRNIAVEYRWTEGLTEATQ